MLKDFAIENRKNKTNAEDKLWQRLRNNQLGSKVRRQHVIEDFIIDFAFLNEKLLIEVDGGYHNDDQQKIYDDMRTHVMGELGYEVLRFTNEEVEQNIEDVLTKISFVLKERAPLSSRRGVGGEV